MNWIFDPKVDASYLILSEGPARLVSVDLIEARVLIDIDKDSGCIMGIEILGDGTGAIARVLERYLQIAPRRLEEDEPPEHWQADATGTAPD